MLRTLAKNSGRIAAYAAILILSSSAQTSRNSELIARGVVERFNEVFNRHDADALASLLTDDTVFEDTSPAPDGQRIEGKTAVVAFWRAWFVSNPDAQFEAEEMIVSADRVVVRWMYHKTAMDSRGTSVVWTCLPCAMGKSPRSSLT